MSLATYNFQTEATTVYNSKDMGNGQVTLEKAHDSCSINEQSLSGYEHKTNVIFRGSTGHIHDDSQSVHIEGGSCGGKDDDSSLEDQDVVADILAEAEADGIE